MGMRKVWPVMCMGERGGEAELEADGWRGVEGVSTGLPRRAQSPDIGNYISYLNRLCSIGQLGTRVAEPCGEVLGVGAELADESRAGRLEALHESDEYKRQTKRMTNSNVFGALDTQSTVHTKHSIHKAQCGITYKSLILTAYSYSLLSLLRSRSTTTGKWSDSVASFTTCPIFAVMLRERTNA